MPFHHQYLLAQLVKGVLVNGGEEEFINFKGYNFSGLKGQTKVSRSGLHFYSSRVTLVLSSTNTEFIDYFLKNLFTFPQIEIGNLVLIPEGVEKEQSPSVNQAMKYVCISPLILLEPDFKDDKSKKFIPPDSDTFSDLLYDSTMLRMEKIGYTPEDIEGFYKFQIVPDQKYLNRIREQQKKFARIYPVYENDVKYEARGYTFPFTLYAAEKVQKFVFMCGLGLFTHKGFGMLDAVEGNPGAHTKKYQYDSKEEQNKNDSHNSNNGQSDSAKNIKNEQKFN